MTYRGIWILRFSDFLCCFKKYQSAPSPARCHNWRTGHRSREPVHPLGDSLTRWVPVPMASDPVHPLGFVATDSPAGCTWPHRFTGGGLRLRSRGGQRCTAARWPAPAMPAARSKIRASCAMGPGRADGRRGQDWEVSRTIFYFFKLTRYPMGSSKHSCTNSNLPLESVTLWNH